MDHDEQVKKFFRKTSKFFQKIISEKGMTSPVIMAIPGEEFTVGSLTGEFGSIAEEKEIEKTFEPILRLLLEKGFVSVCVLGIKDQKIIISEEVLQIKDEDGTTFSRQAKLSLKN